MKTTASAEVISEVQHLVAIAMETPSEVADIFVDYYAHTGSVSVRFHDYGWVADTGSDADWNVYSDDENAVASLSSIREAMEARISRLRLTTKPQRYVEKAEKLRKSAAALLAQAEALEPDEPDHSEDGPTDRQLEAAASPNNRPLTPLENWQQNDEHNVR